MSKYIKMLFTIVIVLIMIVGVSCKIDNYTDKKQNLNAKDVMEYYFDAWNDKHYGRLNAVLSSEMQARTIDYDSVETVEVISCELITSDKLPTMLDGLTEVEIYKIEHNFKYKEESSNDEINTAYYYVGKENESSSWLIYDVIWETQ